MTRRQILQLSAALIGLGSCASALAETSTRKPLRIFTSHLPPWVIERGTAHGAAQELVLELMRRVHRQPGIEFVPWRRAQLLATSTPGTAIFPLTRQPDREQRFRWLAPLYEENYVFLTARKSRFDVMRIGAMKNSRIASLRGGAQIATLQELGFKRVVEASSINEVHRFLLGGMADASFGEHIIIMNSLRTRGEVDHFVLSPPVRTTVAWLAGSLDFDEAQTRQLNATMAEMVADGTHKRVLKKYGLG
ncbi:MAG: ABC transporter substrate-binding protein [Telluria sp.]|nr:ABC transporter substrate-binding protein [Telluria sp.]